MRDRKLVIIHYAGIGENKASGVNVIVPQIVRAGRSLGKVGFYNYDNKCLSIDEDTTIWSNEISDDFHSFPKPFNQPDIVIFHSPFGIPRIVHVARLLVKEEVPYVIVPHGCFSEFSFRQKYIKKVVACNLYFHTLISKASAIQFLTKGEMAHSRYNSKGIILPNGIDVPPELSSYRNLDPMVISYIGRKNIHQKGLDLLIDACGKVARSLHNRIIVNLYGPPEEDATIEQLIQDNGATQIVYNHLGVYGREKTHILRNSSLLVLTSRSEGQPVIVLEAWAGGCPTLLTPGTNMAKEAVENGCGWSVDENPESIAAGILKIASRKDELGSYSQRAYDYVKQNYMWSIVTEKAFSVYEQIVGEHGTHH